MPAITLDTAREVALYIALGAAVVAVAAALVVRAIVAKVFTVVVFAAIAVGVWSQRESLQDCAGDVRRDLAAGVSVDTTCTFFGQDVTVPTARS